MTSPRTPKYRFRASDIFWRKFYHLSPAQKDSVRTAWRLFKANPFDARLDTHPIHRLSARAGRTVYSVCVAKDLRAVFFIERETVLTFDIGSHTIYDA